MSVSSSAAIELVALTNPFTTEAKQLTVTEGLTIADMFEAVGADEMVRRASHVYIGDWYVEPKYWNHVRPRAGTRVLVRAFIPPTGGNSGGGSGGKDLLKTILIIGVAAAALAFGGPLGAAIGLSGALGAAVGQAVIGIGGMLLINALIPPRTNTGGTPNANDSDTKFIEGAQNRAAPFEPVPVTFGYRRVVPRLGAQPYTELVGDDQYLRLLFVWGVGPLDLSDFRIGETSLDNFEDIDIEHFEGLPGDGPATLFPGVVDQEDLQIALLETDGYTIRTTGPDCDEIGVDLVFPNGLITVASDGVRSNRSVAIQIEYSVSGANSWQRIPISRGKRTFSLNWTNTNGTSFNTVTFTQKRTNAIRHGITWKTPARGQYDIRVKRTTADTTSELIRDALYFTTLRTFTNEDPIQSRVPVAKTALRIRATAQLNGVIDNFSGLVKMKATDWNGVSWATRISQNPGTAFRHALQGKATRFPKTDAEIDLTQLQHWSELCTTRGWAFNQTRDFYSSLWDLLTDIAAAGRASPTIIDGKYSVVIDEPKNAVTLISPRNSWGFEMTKVFMEKPHAIRVQFENEEKDFRNDELRVYLDGYNQSTATIYESMDFPGITNPDQLTEQVLFAVACAVQRPEQYTFHQELERLAIRRGSVVELQHDVLLVGLASGRIKSMTTDGGGNVTGITGDEALPMVGGTNYGVIIRTTDDPAVARQVVTVAGEPKTVTFVNPILAADAPEVGDLFAFGVLGSETDEALILGVEPDDEWNATITACPYRELVYTADASIPPFDSKITLLSPVPTVKIQSIRSDETALELGAGQQLNVRIAVKVLPISVRKKLDASLEVQIRPSINDGPFQDAKVDYKNANEFFIGDVRTGEYVDLRFRWNVVGRVPGVWAYQYNYLVIGKSTPPDALTGLTISTFGNQAYIRWTKPGELDVQFGGTVQFRHSESIAPTWGNSVSIGDVAQASGGLATLPLKPGTYLCKVFDQAGNASPVATVNTKQASVLTYGPVSSFSESPTFSGAKSNVILDSVSGTPTLFIDSNSSWDSIPDIDALTSTVDAFGGTNYAVEGVYTFALGFDFGSVKKVRITTTIDSFNASVFDLIDDWINNIDDRQDFDGTETAVCDCKVYVSQTDDDPNASPTWGPYERIDSAEVEARGCRFLAKLTSNNADFNIFVTSLGVRAEEVL